MFHLEFWQMEHKIVPCLVWITLSKLNINPLRAPAPFPKSSVVVV